MRTLEETAIRAARDQPVTRAEAEALVRTVARTCQGLPILTTEQMRYFQKGWNDAFAYGEWYRAHGIAKAAEAVAGVVGAVVDHGDWENLWRKAAAAIYARKGCGYDINDLICATPFDGETRTIKCPKCGNETITHTRLAIEEE